jgi:hypothetical protein
MKSLQDSLKLTPAGNASINKSISDMQKKITKLQNNNTKITMKKAKQNLD